MTPSLMILDETSFPTQTQFTRAPQELRPPVWHFERRYREKEVETECKRELSMFLPFWNESNLKLFELEREISYNDDSQSAPSVRKETDRRIPIFSFPVPVVIRVVRTTTYRVQVGRDIDLNKQSKKTSNK